MGHSRATARRDVSRPIRSLYLTIRYSQRRGAVAALTGHSTPHVSPLRDRRFSARAGRVGRIVRVPRASPPGDPAAAVFACVLPLWLAGLGGGRRLAQARTGAGNRAQLLRPTVNVRALRGVGAWADPGVR